MTIRKVGRFAAGYVKFTLYVDTEYGGGSYELWDTNEEFSIIVGIEGDWRHTMGVFLHELTEAIYAFKGCKYTQAPNLSNSSGACILSANHDEYSEIIAWVAEGIISATEELKNTYWRIKGKEE